MKAQIMKPANEILRIMKEQQCRQIVFNRDPKTDMFAILVVDTISDKRNKAGKLKEDNSFSGGTRFAHKDADVALRDAMRLARAMTLKSKVLGINEGGAKAVILDNHKKSKRFLHSIGDFIQMQKGSFKTAIDLGFNLNDARIIASKTDFIDSLSHNIGGLGSTGENTAEGIVHGFEVISKEILKKPLKDCSISIQGLGSIGMALARKLILAVLTYFVIVIFFYFAGLPKPFINSIVPALAFILSTLSLPFFKRVWMQFYKKQ